MIPAGWEVERLWVYAELRNLTPAAAARHRSWHEFLERRGHVVGTQLTSAIANALGRAVLDPSQGGSALHDGGTGLLYREACRALRVALRDEGFYQTVEAARRMGGPRVVGELVRGYDWSRVLQAAYRLGGTKALLPLLAPREEVACPRCGGCGEDPEVTTLWDKSGPYLKPIKERSASCSLCAGGGVVTRAVCQDSLRNPSVGARL